MKFPASRRNPAGTRLLALGAMAFSLVTLLPMAGAALAPKPAVGILLPDTPVLTVAETKPNVLLVLDNSNSMDESASGAAVGSNSPESKSEIARGVIESMLSTYQGRMSVGLMAYKLNEPTAGYLHNSPYDASYNPANYDPGFMGSRSAQTKRHRQLKPGSTNEYVYYNVALPFYSTRNEGTLYCYSGTASFDNGSEKYPGGPWDNYECFRTKTGTSDAAPASDAGYGSRVGTYTFSPTDSDLAQGILDFGRRMASYYVSRTWMRNDSPGRGYLHVPVKPLDATQSAALLSKLACNVPDQPSPCASTGIQNAGLTPIEGTLLTAGDYYDNKLLRADEGYTASTYPLPVTCAKNYVILLTDGMPSTDKDGKALSDPASAINAAANAAAALKAKGVVTYVVGFALPTGVDASTLNKIAQAGGTATAYNASDKDSLDVALGAIFASIEGASGSSGAVATNSTGLSTDTRLYSAGFDPKNWSGWLRGYPVPANNKPANWNASIPAEGSRRIYTWTGTSAVEFKWGNLTGTPQATGLGSADVVNYLRGDRSKEGSTFRVRGSLLGDIVNSAPVHVREEVNGTKPAMEIVAVGANDGMLHIFDAATGVEKFAYVPAGLDWAALKSYTAPGYEKAHRFFVDGQLAISAREDTAGGRNILVGTLGRGGRGAFALDVTNPDSITVLWDTTGSAAPDGMGYVVGAPFISKVAAGNKATADVVVIPNGVTRPGALYEGGDQASLFVLNLFTGALQLDRIDAIDSSDKSGLSNALSTPAGWDVDGDGSLEYVYAGDLRGNVWKFELTGNNPSASRLFVAERAGKRQPITGGVSVSLEPASYARWIHFGTGRFLQSADLLDRDVQSLYGVIDSDPKSPLTRSDLQERKIQSELTDGDGTQRFFEPNGTLSSSKKGWFVDLEDPTVGAEGERIIGRPQDVAGQLRVSSGIPGAGACDPVSGGFLYVLDAYSGTSTPFQAIDVNGDGIIDASDSKGGKKTGGLGLSGGLVGDSVQTGDQLSVGLTNDSRTSRKVDDRATRGRTSWRELIQE